MPLFLALIGVLVASHLNATTIVGVWTEERVALVADSKVTIMNREGRYVGSDTGCKVHVVKGVIVGTAGLLKNETVSVIAAIEGAMEFRDQETGKPLPEMGPIIAAQLAVEKALSARTPDDFDPTLAVALIIAAKEQGRPALTRAEWIPIRPDRLPKDGLQWNRYGTRRFKYPENRNDSENPNRGLEIIGIRTAIDRYKSGASKADWNDSDTVRFAKKLVLLEANDSVDSAVVGEPLTVITIDKDGIRWHERGACKE